MKLHFRNKETNKIRTLLCYSQETFADIQIKLGAVAIEDFTTKKNFLESDCYRVAPTSIFSRWKTSALLFCGEKMVPVSTHVIFVNLMDSIGHVSSRNVWLVNLRISVMDTLQDIAQTLTNIIYADSGILCNADFWEFWNAGIRCPDLKINLNHLPSGWNIGKLMAYHPTLSQLQRISIKRRTRAAIQTQKARCVLQKEVNRIRDLYEPTLARTISPGTDMYHASPAALEATFFLQHVPPLSVLAFLDVNTRSRLTAIACLF